jgi:hypothetical protein
MPDIVLPDGKPAVAEIPKIKGVHPTGSKILIETLTPRELNPTTIEIPEGMEEDSGSNQAYIIELGPAMPDDSGLEVGQRIYWEGRGMPVEDPRTKSGGRIRAILEIHNVKAIIEEEG